MAEERNPPGYNVDPGAYTLDLYRLLCMVMADQRVAKLGSTSYYSAIARLRREYLDNEVKRALISSATALRIWLDQRPKRAFSVKTNCGKLFPDWPKQKKTCEVLTLREACNKIIHATEINEDLVVPDKANNPDYEGAYVRPYLYLYGVKDERSWRAVLSIVDFVKWGTAVFWRWG